MINENQKQRLAQALADAGYEAAMSGEKPDDAFGERIEQDLFGSIPEITADEIVEVYELADELNRVRFGRKVIDDLRTAFAKVGHKPRKNVFAKKYKDKVRAAIVAFGDQKKGVFNIDDPELIEIITDITRRYLTEQETMVALAEYLVAEADTVVPFRRRGDR